MDQKPVAAVGPLWNFEQMREPLRVQRQICFYETDAMAVVHHSNYFRFFEEARMHWYLDRKVEAVDVVNGERINFAVVEAQALYRSPARYTDQLETTLQVRQEGARLRFQYTTTMIRENRIVATGYTLHVPVTSNMKVCRLTPDLIQILKEEPWTEI